MVPHHYCLSIEPDFAEESFSGTVEIDVEVTEPVSSIVLHNDGLDITAATVGGHAAEVSVDPPMEQMILHVEAPAGATTISLSFEGRFNDRLVGFYLSTFSDAAGTERVIATTQFEAPHARKAFPCWDEPAHKSTFEISLRVPSGMEAVSNAGEVRRDSHGDGSHTVHFARTMVMSTYLVAWVIGPLVFSETRHVDGVPLRVVSRAGLADMTAFALDAAEFGLRYFADYFDVAYPGDKVDLVAIPDFAFGAMENLGCITFREALLMVDPHVTTQTEMQRAVDVINHELAHMWFGDLVTMVWWNGIWLNEAFATFMEMKCTDAYRPEWRRWADFGLSRTAAFTTDALASTRPIEFAVNTPEDSEGMFDILTYEKGAAVVRMLEQHLGEDRFRDGLRAYMADNAYGNTETTDLWDALEASSGQPVRKMMDGWIFHGGFPLITVEFDGARATLAQRRCVNLGGGTEASPHTWDVPLRYRQIGPGESVVERLVLGSEPVTIDLDADSLFLLNAAGASFVRVFYPADHVESLASLEVGVLSEVERYALLDDAWANLLAGATTSTAFLTLLEAMAAETSCSVWERMIHALDDLSRLVDEETKKAFTDIAHDILSPMLANLGLVPVRDEPHGDRRLRADLVKAIGTIAEDPDVQAECQRTVSVGRRDATLVEPSLMAAAVHVAAHVGDEADFDDFVAEYHENTNPQEQLRYLFALTRFPSDELTGRFRQMVLDGDVRSQNAPFALRSALTNPATGTQTWEFMKSNWDRLMTSLPAGSIGRMLEGLTSLDTPEMVNDVESFLGTHPVPGAEKIIDQVLEKQRVNASLRSRESQRLSSFVAG